MKILFRTATLLLCLSLSAPLLYGCAAEEETGTVITTSPLPDSKLVSSEESGDLTYSLYEDYAEVSAYRGDDPSPVIPSEYASLPVMSIGERSFAGNTSLQSISLPSSVAMIGTRAFEGCTALTSVEMPGVTTVGSYAFFGSALTEVPFSPVLSVIGRYAFSGSAVTELSLPKTLQRVGDYAFENCTSLSSLTVEEGFDEIPSRAFSGCTALSAVSVPDSVKKIGEYAFAYCTSITRAEIGGKTSLGEGAFYNCGELTISAPSGSEAEKYAKRYGLTFEAK